MGVVPRIGRPPQTHCINGHEFTPENTYVLKSGHRTGTRSCRACRQKASREAMAAKYVRHPRPEPNISSDPLVLAYAAGIVDGEGSIIVRLFSNRGSEPRYHNVHVSVTSTDPRLTDWLKMHFGGQITVGKKGLARQSPAAKWALLARHCDMFLRAIRPYLVIKADQADVALKLRETLGVNKHTPVTDELFAYREHLREELSRLKTWRRLADTPTPDEEGS